MIYSVIMLLIVVGAIAALGNDGAWGAGIMLINVLVAALLATNFWEPIAAMLLSTSAGGEFFWDFFVLMGLFCVIVMVLRTATDKISRKRVQLPKMVDLGAGYFFAAWTGWVLVCFLSMAAQTAPLPRNFMGFEPEQNNFLGVVAPDRMWLGVVQRLSQQSLMPLTAAEPENANGAHVFDPQGEFLFKYASHRDKYATPESVSAGISGVLIQQ